MSFKEIIKKLQSYCEFEEYESLFCNLENNDFRNLK